MATSSAESEIETVAGAQTVAGDGCAQREREAQSHMWLLAPPTSPLTQVVVGNEKQVSLVGFLNKMRQFKLNLIELLLRRRRAVG